MTDFLDDIMSEVEEISSTSDKLDLVRKAMKQLRALEYKKEQLEADLAETKRSIIDLTDRELVKLFSAANITSLTLEAEGNYPAMKFDKATYYNAKIPEDKEVEAFAWLHDEGHGDLVKTQITTALGMGERSIAEQVEEAIASLGVDYNSKLTVHPSTLKAFVKSEIESGRALPMDLLGVTMGETVKIKKAK